MEKLVLIVDDDPVYVRFMQEHFRRIDGFVTEGCVTGEAALLKLATTKPYLIMLDHHLTDPAKDGTYYLKAIRKLNSKIPVIYMTIDPSEHLKTKVLRLGVQGFISKNEAFLVNLRTAIDTIEETSKKQSLLSKLFSKPK